MAKPLTLTEGRIRAMTAAFQDLSQEGVLATSVPFFSPDDINLLIKQCSKLPMRQAKPRVGAEGREVIQDFDITEDRIGLSRLKDWKNKYSWEIRGANTFINDGEYWQAQLKGRHDLSLANIVEI